MTESRNFRELLDARMAEGKSVCVGLDADASKIPGGFDGQVDFCRRIIEATADIAVAFKPNAAFFEASAAGLDRLQFVVAIAKSLAPEVPVIVDAKRGDIGNTNDGYVTSIFDTIGADAVTVHNYLGREALEPFLARKEKGVIVLCRTSNPGAGEFQDLMVEAPQGSFQRWGLLPSRRYMMLYEYVAYAVSQDWNQNGNCCLVVGATYPSELRVVRQIVGDDIPLLIPGIGAQGGEVKATVKSGRNSTGNGMIINSSRGIIFADDPRQAALDLHNEINGFRAEY